MTNTLRFKTNLNCGSCVASVMPYLDSEASISRWNVDTSSPDKILTVEGDGVSEEKVRAAVTRAGFNVLGDSRPVPVASPAEPPASVSYYPLVLLVVFLVGAVSLGELQAGNFVWERLMQNFMGAFFVTFSFFKLLDLRGFADSYSMYDVVARRVPAYGYAYPFIELALGVAYLARIQPIATNFATLIVMAISAVGVVQSLLAKRKIRCACLGTVFNLPMSTVTLVEDASMIVMAIAMLLSHSVH